MSSELTEDNPYSRFETRNFGNVYALFASIKVHAIVFYSSSSDIQYLDLCQ